VPVYGWMMGLLEEWPRELVLALALVQQPAHWPSLRRAGYRPRRHRCPRRIWDQWMFPPLCLSDGLASCLDAKMRMSVGKKKKKKRTTNTKHVRRCLLICDLTVGRKWRLSTTAQTFQRNQFHVAATPL
jgi:hypothetical protein